MKSFLEKHERDILGVLNGWDRAVFRGTLRVIANVEIMMRYLWRRQVLLKEFTEYAKALTQMLVESSVAQAERSGRPNRYLPSSRESKEEIAREIAQRDGIEEGLICVLRCVEPCLSYEVYRSRERKKLELRMVPGKRVEDIVAPVCKRKGDVRALRPWSHQDQAILQAVSACGLAGDFRNRDLARHLYPKAEPRQVSGKVTYRLRLLRAHGLIQRLPNTRRYRITKAGASVIATIFLTQQATAKQLCQAVA